MASPSCACDSGGLTALRSPDRHVLVVGTVAGSRHQIASLLRARDYHVAEAADGSEASAMVRGERFDLLIFDVIAPTLDGRDFGSTQRECDAMQAVATILLLPHIDDAAYPGLPAADALIPRPFDDARVLELTQMLCASASSRHAGATAAENPIFWSKNGQVACPTHAPAAGSPPWIREEWTPVPGSANGSRSIYFCFQCALNKQLHRRRGPVGSPDGV